MARSKLMLISLPRQPKSPQLVKSGINFLGLAWTQPKSQGAEISAYLLEMDDQAANGLGEGYLNTTISPDTSSSQQASWQPTLG